MLQEKVKDEETTKGVQENFKISLKKAKKNYSSNKNNLKYYYYHKLGH